jgi:amidase
MLVAGEMQMATFITRLSPPAGGTRLAVKDLIDIAGLPTTAGCRAVADAAAPAAADAACLAGARAAAAAIVGKTNLTELAYGGSGINRWFGTPVNPLDPGLVPGGSSSGSAVAVADGDADIAYGSDTAGSVRIPAAFCGMTGLKTTHGRIPLQGVWPLAPSLDTVGPLSRDVAGVAAGMALLEPGFAVSAGPARRVGRLRLAQGSVDRRIDAAVDAALARSGLEVTDVSLPGWQDALRAGRMIMVAEAAQSDAHLLADPVTAAKISQEVRVRFAEADTVVPEQLQQARLHGQQWRAALAAIFSQVQLLALPTVCFFPPPLDDAGRRYNECTLPFSLAGVPALALPVPAGFRLPASLQLVGPADSEDVLLATGAIVEAAVA